MSQEPAKRLTVSVVVPALNENDHVPDLVRYVDQLAAAASHYMFELVVVDDGSTDGMVESLSSVRATHFELHVIQLSRNFGSHAAISAGLRGCRGDCAIVLGADGQEPISLATELLERWQDGCEVVWGVPRSRVTPGPVRRLASKAFSFLFARYAALENYPAEGPSGVLVDRAVLAELNAMGELNRNVLALIAWLGYRQSQVHYDQLPRRHGSSRWTSRKMFKLAVDSLIQFSSAPLRFCTFAGMGVATLGAVYALILIIRETQGVTTPSGWPTLLVVTLLLGGTQLLVIGVLGEYLWRAVEETRRRPLYIVRRQFSVDSKNRDELGANDAPQT